MGAVDTIDKKWNGLKNPLNVDPIPAIRDQICYENDQRHGLTTLLFLVDLRGSLSFIYTMTSRARARAAN